MAKNTVYEWDPVAANNTDIAGINIQGSAAVSNFDDAFRTSMAQIKSGVDYKQVYAVQTGNYTAVLADNNAFHAFTGATPTLSLTAAATLGANWHYSGYNTGGAVTVDPNGAELINGSATLSIPVNSYFVIYCTGTAFTAVVCPSGLITSANILDGSIANADLANMAQATIKGRASGAGTGVPTDLTAADVFAILGSLVPARPISGAGVGQFATLSTAAGASYTLPAGGTWAAFWVGFSSVNSLWVAGGATTVAAGGTLIQTGNANTFYTGFAWRIA